MGKNTKKVLFVGTRNKYCLVCMKAENEGRESYPHKCFKNWEGSSAAMEADIIVEGFNKSIQNYGLKYLSCIADGDSSVYAKILRNVHYGQEVKKIECLNHLIKNVGKALFKIKSDTNINAGGRKLLTSQAIKRLQQHIRKCVNNSVSVENMKKNIENGPYHIFGHHTHCDSSYCEVVGNLLDSKYNILHSSGIIYHIKG